MSEPMQIRSSKAVINSLTRNVRSSGFREITQPAIAASGTASRMAVPASEGAIISRPPNITTVTKTNNAFIQSICFYEIKQLNVVRQIRPGFSLNQKLIFAAQLLYRLGRNARD